MIIGTPKEIKNHEYRVGLTPESARELVVHGHRVLVQTGAGEGIGAHDRYYVEAGAEIVQTAEEIFATCEMVVKVKEPQPVERAMLRPDQILYTYLHLAPDPDQTRDLMKSGAVCIAYETVTSPHGGLPLLKPMSQVAGRMSIQAGATALEKAHGGRGVLLGGVPGVAPGKVCVIGGGVVGFNAAQMAAGLGADVTILDRDPEVLERVGTFFEARAKTRFSNRANLAECVAETSADIAANGLIGPVVGHVGDGNFHTQLLIDITNPEEIAKAEAVISRMNERAIALDGTCTGEHGVGQGKRKYLVKEHGHGLDIMRVIKAALDPLGILNPGKILPDA